MKIRLIALLMAASCLLTACGTGEADVHAENPEPPSALETRTDEFWGKDVNLLVFNFKRTYGYWYIDRLAAA